MQRIAFVPPVARHYDTYDLGNSIAVLEQEMSTIAKQQKEESQALRASIRDTLTLVKEQGVEFRTEMRTLGEKFAASQRTNWPVVIGFITVVLVVLGMGGKLIALQTDSTVAHALQDFAAARNASLNEMRRDLDNNTARDEVSISERKTHAEEIGKLRLDMANVKTDQRVVDAKLVEVETQFRASDQSRNVQFAEQQRMNNLLMQLAQGVKPVNYPNAPYFFPGIAQDMQPNGQR